VKKGITVDLVSRDKLDELSSEERINYIIDEVRKGKILVLERGLTSSERVKLIQQTMEKIDHDTFIGIEIEGYPEEKRSFIHRMFGMVGKPRITVIGPAHLLKTIRRDDRVIETVIVPGRRDV